MRNRRNTTLVFVFSFYTSIKNIKLKLQLKKKKNHISSYFYMVLRKKGVEVDNGSIGNCQQNLTL